MSKQQQFLFELEGVHRPAVTAKRLRAKRVKPQAPTGAQPTVARGSGTWTIAFPAPAKMLSSNSRHHWRSTSPIRKAWREAMFWHATAAKLPTGLAKVRVDVVLRFPTAARKDAPNYHQWVLKPLVDALGPAREQTIRRGPRAGTVVREVGYGLIPDDTQQYVDGPFPRIGEPVRDKAMPFGQVTVTITDLSAEVTA